MSKWKSWFAAVTMAVAAMVGTPAFAQATEKVVNGGFESGSFSSWTVEAGADALVQMSPRSGTYNAAIGGPAASFAGISQNVTGLTANTNYTFSFYVRGVNGGNNQVQAFFGGNQVYTATDLRATGYMLQTYTVTPTTTSATIRFAVQNTGANRIAFDDISVRAVPEPATWALMIVGFGMIGAALRRRRRNAEAQARDALLLV